MVFVGNKFTKMAPPKAMMPVPKKARTRVKIVELLSPNIGSLPLNWGILY